MLVVSVHFINALFKFTWNRINVWSFCVKYKLQLYRIDVVVVQSI